MTSAQPLQAAGASALSFVLGGLLPFSLVFVFEPEQLYWAEYIFSITFLALLGGISAWLGGSSVFRSILRISIWGTVTMVLSSLVGSWVQLAV
jgi:VIT1/CCC1 family predicted Fe2+/Mn2+ transporter